MLDTLLLVPSLYFDILLHSVIYKQGRTSLLHRIALLMYNKRQGAILDDASSVN